MSLNSFLGMGIPRHPVMVLQPDPPGNGPNKFDCRQDQHLLVAMKSIGGNYIPSGCHGGGCGVCKVRVVSGNYEKLPMSRKHVSEDEEQLGYALACRVLPRSPITVEVVPKKRQ